MEQKRYLIENSIEYGIIYGHKCINTNLWYVGLTTTSIEHRSQLDGSMYLKKKDGLYVHPKFAPAIVEYGWDTFEHHILGYYPISELSDMEKYWILEKNSFENGYNATEGGLNTWPKYLSENAKSKISESNRNRKVSDETKKKISAAKKGKRYLSDEHYKKLSELLKVKNIGVGTQCIIENKALNSEMNYLENTLATVTQTMGIICLRAQKKI